MVRMRLPQHYFLPANYYYIPKAKTPALAQPPQGLRGEMNVHYLPFVPRNNFIVTHYRGPRYPRRAYRGAGPLSTFDF